MSDDCVKNSVCVYRTGPLYDFLIDLENRGAVFTGSRAFGLHKGNADWDYFMLKSAYDQLGLPVYETSSSYADSEFKHIRFHLFCNGHDKEIDLLLMLPEVYACWYWANICFFKLLELPGFKRRMQNKSARVKWFEFFKENRRNADTVSD